MEQVEEREGPGEDAGRGVSALSAQQLETEIITLVTRLSSGTYELLALVGELDVRGTWARSGALSCAAWLADACDIDVATARTQVRVARALRSHPVLDHAMYAGDVSYAKARVLVPHLTPDSVDDLVTIAARTPAGQLGSAIAAWSMGHEHPDDIAHRHRRERSTRWRTDADGMVTITTRLPPADAAVICAAIDQRVRTQRAPAGACLHQHRADALVDVVTSGGGSVRAEVVVHIRGDDPSRLADGTPLCDHAVASMLPDAFISLLLHDMEGHPIDASPRRRSPTRRQRRVVDEIHTECAHRGCRARHFLQYDHEEPYWLGGPTVIANLQRLCGPHNRGRYVGPRVRRTSSGPPSRRQPG